MRSVGVPEINTLMLVCWFGQQATECVVICRRQLWRVSHLASQPLEEQAHDNRQGLLAVPARIGAAQHVHIQIQAAHICCKASIVLGGVVCVHVV